MMIFKIAGRLLLGLISLVAFSSLLSLRRVIHFTAPSQLRLERKASLKRLDKRLMFSV